MKASDVNWVGLTAPAEIHMINRFSIENSNRGNWEPLILIVMAYRVWCELNKVFDGIDLSMQITG